MSNYVVYMICQLIVQLHITSFHGTGYDSHETFYLVNDGCQTNGTDRQHH